MSTNKLLQSLSEDPQLEKQIGCMAGILQLFDRHQVLTGRRLYGHKRISAAAPKTQTSPPSNCGSPASETSATSSENMVRHPSDNQKQKHTSPTAAGIAASPEEQMSQTLPSPSTPTDVKSSSVYGRTPSFPLDDTSPNGSSGDQLPKISFDMARSSILTPRRLDSSRSLHEGRVNVSHEGKVFARRSVDTAERAAAAARGALKELSRISTDFTGASHRTDQVSIREIVRSSFSKEQQVPKSTVNASLSGSSWTTHTTFAPRMSNEGSICTPKPGLAKDMSRAQHIEAKSSAESNSAEKTMQPSNAFVPHAAGRVEASRPPRHCKPKSVETPTQSRADISESLRLLAKLREATPAYNSLLGGNATADNVGNKVQFSANHAPRLVPSSLDIAEGPVTYASRAPLPRPASDRIPDRMSSYEPSRSSSVDLLVQGGPKAREIPRLSLDGRGSGAGFKADREAGTHGRPQYPRSLLNSRSVSCSNSDCDTESLHEKRTSFSSNVVAKLMGLDAMPNGEPAEAAQLQNKLDPYGSLDQKAQRMSNTAVQDTNPTFSQCGKYVSASFFPSKRRNDIKIAIDPEEEEEDSYLQMDPLSHQEARTLSVRVGSSNLQAGHRLATTESAHMGHPCYQPKNHHLMEDRPPHVLSPAARLCAQIEEMQRADSLHKGVDRGFRTTEMQQSAQQDLEALKQLLGAIHLNKEYSNGVGSHLEELEVRGTSGKRQPESRRLPDPHGQYAEQQPPPSAVIWKTKRMLNDELYAHAHYQNPNSRKITVESHNRKVRHSIQDPDSLPLSRQPASAQIYNQATRTRAEMRSSPAVSHPSTYSTPRKTNVSNECITPIGSANANTPNMARRMASRTNSPPNFMSPRFSPSPQSPFSQQLRQSYYSNCSWEGSSVSSTSSGFARDQHPLGNSDYRAADKKNKQVERVERKKVSNSILKDKEESKANLVFLKPSPNTPVEKRSNSGVGSRSSARTARRCVPPQNPEHVRSSMRSPTKSSARKAEGVKRKLNFVNRSPGRIRPVEMDSKDQDTEFVDKTVVSSIENNGSSKHHSQVRQSEENVSETGHDGEPCSTANSHGNQLFHTSSNITPMKTKVEVKSPQLPLPCADGESNDEGEQITASICNRDPREHITEDVGSPATPMRSPAAALKLPQVPQQENEDTESQGEKSTGSSCEQPSPISVLEGPFYEEDVSSPPTSTKFRLELEEEASGKDVKEVCEIPQSSPQLSECRSPCCAADFDYVKHLLDMTGTPMDIDDKRQSIGMVKLRPLQSYFFLQLEEENLNAPDCKSELGSMWRRRLLFDSVNASLERRLRRWRLCQRQPWLLACEPGLYAIMAEDCSPALQQGMIGLDEEKNVCLSREGGRVLLEEVWEEVGGMHGEQRRKRRKKMCKQQSVGTSASEAEEGEEAEDGICDAVGCMLEEDLFGGPFHTRRPDTWASLQVEKGELGLDLERLIFKDLIDHTIRDLGLSILPTTKRQLFKPHT